MSGIPNHYDTKCFFPFTASGKKRKKEKEGKKMQEENAKGPRAGGSARNS